VLDVTDLRHAFGERVALAGVDLRVEPGEIVGLVGRNGAGKTTTMRAIMGILEPDGGAVRWDGTPIDERRRLRFGYMPEERGLYAQMRLADQVAYFARLHDLPARTALASAHAWLERLGLGERAQERLIALSHGNQQRVQLAVALVHDPALLVLDEPFGGLDPEAVESLSDVLRERAQEGVAVLFSSHQLELVERVCRSVVILDAGRVLAAGTLRELREHLPAQLRVKVDAPPDWADGLEGARRVHADENGVVLIVDPGADVQAVLRTALAAGPVEHFGYELGGLVDIYRELALR
jgi:ABC-2 type transport system ATP-binding protein